MTKKKLKINATSVLLSASAVAGFLVLAFGVSSFLNVLLKGKPYPDIFLPVPSFMKWILLASMIMAAFLLLYVVNTVKIKRRYAALLVITSFAFGTLGPLIYAQLDLLTLNNGRCSEVQRKFDTYINNPLALPSPVFVPTYCDIKTYNPSLRPYTSYSQKDETRVRTSPWE